MTRPYPVFIPEHPSMQTQVACIGRHVWSVPRLIELSRDLPVMRVPIEHLNIYSKYENLTLRQMVGHMLAIQQADLSKPIILDEDGDIMDGRHRIMKALLLKRRYIKAVRFSVNPSPCRVEDNK